MPIDTINTIAPIRLITPIYVLGLEELVGLGEGVGLADVDDVEVTAAVSFYATYANW